MNRREQFLHDILNINPNYDIDLINRAYSIAEDMHNGQLRKSGEPYIIHPVEVARILAELGMDDETLHMSLILSNLVLSRALCILHYIEKLLTN